MSSFLLLKKQPSFFHLAGDTSNECNDFTVLLGSLFPSCWSKCLVAGFAMLRCTLLSRAGYFADMFELVWTTNL